MRFRDVMRDERGFVHKRLIGLGKGALGIAGRIAPFIPGGGTVARGLEIVRRTLGGGRGGVSTDLFVPDPRIRETTVAPRTLAERIDIRNIAGDIGCPGPIFCRDADDSCVTCESIAEGQLNIGTGAGAPCDDPDLVRDPQTGICEFPGSPFGGVGEARMGRFGAALEPRFVTINTRRCLRGMVLGVDSLCYNKGSISNKQRFWPRGRRPLLTGGEMRAIGIAASAGRKLERTQKRLRGLGFMKGPSQKRLPSKAKGTQVVKVLESGPGSVQI